jgi:hypothetical protein
MTPAELRDLNTDNSLSGPCYLSPKEHAILNHADALLRVAEAAERVILWANHNLICDSSISDLRQSLAALREVKP